MLRSAPPAAKASTPAPAVTVQVSKSTVDAEGQDVQPTTDRPLLRKIWYIVTAITFFVLILVSLIAASYLIFFQNNQTCGAKNNVAINSAIATIVVASLALVLVVGFVALQIRDRRNLRREARAQEEEGIEMEDIRDEEEDVTEKPKKRFLLRRDAEAEDTSTKPLQIDPLKKKVLPEEVGAILKNLSFPHDG